MTGRLPECVSGDAEVSMCLWVIITQWELDAHHSSLMLFLASAFVFMLSSRCRACIVIYLGCHRCCTDELLVSLPRHRVSAALCLVIRRDYECFFFTYGSSMHYTKSWNFDRYCDCYSYAITARKLCIMKYLIKRVSPCISVTYPAELSLTEYHWSSFRENNINRLTHI